MPILKATMAAICLVSLPTLARATPPPNTLSTAGELAWMCAGDPERSDATEREARSVSALQCWAYIRGVVGAYMELRDRTSAPQICLPPDVDEIRIANAFQTWATRQRASPEMPAARGVIAALSETFPCVGR